jgi:ABC-type uncharacterized transport system permease subunit
MFKKYIPINLLAGFATLIGGTVWRIVFRARRAVNWSDPPEAALSLWWMHLSIWVALLFGVSLILLFLLFRKRLDLRGTIATIGLLAASWSMFVVSNIFNDTMIALREQDFRLRVLSNVISAVDVVLWLMMFFVLFRSVDDVRVP